MRAPDGFRSLASMLRADTPKHIDDATSQVRIDADSASCEASPGAEQALQELLRDLRLFRARIADLLEESIEKLRCDVAAHVVARELHLAPVDLQSIAERALARCLDEQPVRIRVAPSDLDAVALEYPIVTDDRLRPGDLIIELPGGSLDLTLGARLGAILRSIA